MTIVALAEKYEGLAVDTTSGVQVGVVLIQGLGHAGERLCMAQATLDSLHIEEIQSLGMGPMREALTAELLRLRANGLENGRVNLKQARNARYTPPGALRTKIPASSRARTPKYAGRVELAQEHMTQLISDMAIAIEGPTEVTDVESARFAQRYSQMREEITAMRAAVDALEGSWEMVQSQMIRLMG